MMAKKKQRNMPYPFIAYHLTYYAHMLNGSAASEFPLLIYNLTFPQECYQVTFARHIPLPHHMVKVADSQKNSMGNFQSWPTCSG
jgi:hypothetical protein